MLGKITTAFVASRVKTQTGKAGLVGVLAGLAATTILRRSVPGAILVGGGMVAYELYKIKQEIDAKKLAEAQAKLTETVIVDLQPGEVLTIEGPKKV